MLDGINGSSIKVMRIFINILNFSRKSGMNFTLNDIAGLIDKTIELALIDYDNKKYYFRQILNIY